MTRFLACFNFGRILLIPVIIWCNGYSFAQLLCRRVFRSKTMDPQDKLRLSGFASWLRIPKIWDRLMHPEAPEYDSLFDSLKDAGVEHAREFTSTAVKFYSFLLLCSIILGAIGWVL